MADAINKLVQDMAQIKADLLKSEADTLLPFYLAGGRIVPSDMVDRTTVMVTPRTYEALKAAVART